ncbi:MAG TPA: peptide ABC transporter substrate-binding protein [Chloroflexia bacterium]|nr:peptide ABC transporter substrate-binding protein [Chloroflexia bacterium]
MDRSFRTQVLIGLAGVLALVIVLAAGPRPAPEQADVPARPGDTYVEAMVGEPHLVNPLLATSETDTDLAHLVFSGLARVNERGELAPDLASGWESSADSTVFTYTLKPNLRWHDGEPLTVSDVIWTFGAIQARGFPGDPLLAEAWKGVEVSTPATDTVRFTLPAPDATFPEHTTIGIMPRHVWGEVKAEDLARSELNRSPVGSGPWRYVGLSIPGVDDAIAGENTGQTPVPTVVEAQEGVVLEPNPYSSTGGLQVSRIWFRQYPTLGAAITAFQQGEVHGLGHVPPDRLAEVMEVDGAQVHTQTLARYNMMMVNVASPLFDRAETRQALEFAINRGAVAEAMGDGSVPAHSPILPHSWAHDASIEARPHGPAQAGRLLDEAGWVRTEGGVRARDGVTLTVVLAANSEMAPSAAAAERIADDLRAVGVDVQLALVPRETLLRDYLGPRAFHLAVVGWESQGAEPDLYRYWHSSQNVSGGLNFSGWASEAADRALAEAHTNPDKEARRRAYSDFQRAFQAEVPAVVLSTPVYAYVTQPPASGVALPDADLLTPAARFDALNGWALAGR